MYLLIFDAELNHAAARRKLIHLSHCEDGSAAESFQKMRKQLSFRGTYKDEMAAVRIGVALQTANEQAPAVHGIAGKLIESGAEWIAPHGTQHDGSFRARKSGWGPLDKLEKVKEDGGLQLVFLAAISLRGNKHREESEAAEQKINSTPPHCCATQPVLQPA